MTDICRGCWRWSANSEAKNDEKKCWTNEHVATYWTRSLIWAAACCSAGDGKDGKCRLWKVLFMVPRHFGVFSSPLTIRCQKLAKFSSSSAERKQKSGGSQILTLAQTVTIFKPYCYFASTYSWQCRTEPEKMQVRRQKRGGTVNTNSGQDCSWEESGSGLDKPARLSFSCSLDLLLNERRGL